MKFISQSTGEETRPAQYLAELVCLRQGKKKRIATPPRFWNLPQWKQEYGRQIALANGLLKMFRIESILSALNCKDGNWIFSLSYKGLVDIIIQHESKLEKQEKKEKEKPTVVYDKEIKTEVTNIRTGKSIIDKLKDLE